MTTRRDILAAAGSALSLAWTRRARATTASDGVSDWVAGDHTRLRLIDAGPNGAGRLCGLQIELDPSFLTYWRTPGEAGVPPTLTFEGSRNLASARLLFPAPQRFDEGGAEAFGYMDEVVFPIDVVPADPGRPVSLAVSVSFAVCSTLCLPASGKLGLDLVGDGKLPEGELVRDAVRRVPVPSPFGGPGPLAIESIAPGGTPDRARVIARAPAGPVPTLFVEAPEPWYIHAEPGVALGSGKVGFDLRVLSGSKAPASVPLTLTLVAADLAIETATHLDAAAPTP